MEALLDFLSLADSNVRYVLLGTLLLTTATSIVGCFALLRKRALIGDAIAHSVLPGIMVAFMLTGVQHPLWLTLGAIISGALAVIAIELIIKYSKLKSDAAIAIVLSVFFGAGIFLMSIAQRTMGAAQAGLDKFFLGRAASLVKFDVIVLCIVATAIIAIVTVCFKYFRLVSFNREYGRSKGINVARFEQLLSVLTIAAIAIGIQTVGVVLIAAMLIIPAAIGRIWTDSLVKMIFAAVLFGVVAAFTSVYISYSVSAAPTGPWMVIIMSVIALISILLAPSSGLLWSFHKKHKLQLKIEGEHFLKFCYKQVENEYQSNHISTKDLNQYFESGSRFLKKKAVRQLVRKNFVTAVDGQYKLLSLGIDEAKNITRKHRLWEMYLSQKMMLPSDHVHPDADAIEHIITPEIEAQLIAALDKPEKDPHDKDIPY